jgi:hypothetical protein
MLSLRDEGSGRSLIAGPGSVKKPVKKRGPWVTGSMGDANLRVVTLLWQRSRLGRWRICIAHALLLPTGGQKMAKQKEPQNHCD